MGGENRGWWGRACSTLTLFAVMPILVEPETIFALAHIAPERVDTLMLAATVVLGTLVLVWGNRQTFLRRITDLDMPFAGQDPEKGSLPRSFPECPIQVSSCWGDEVPNSLIFLGIILTLIFSMP